jgi:hypothetical protein
MFGSNLWTSDSALPEDVSLLSACRHRATTWRTLCPNVRMDQATRSWSFFLANDTILVAHERYDDDEYVYCSANKASGQKVLRRLAKDLNLDIFPR